MVRRMDQHRRRAGPLSTRLSLGGRDLHTLVFQSGTIMRIALRLDDPSGPGRPTAGPPDEAGHGQGDESGLRLMPGTPAVPVHPGRWLTWAP
jgi:hypothetical protein